jgi:hypothetical protein
MPCELSWGRGPRDGTHCRRGGPPPGKIRAVNARTGPRSALPPGAPPAVPVVRVPTVDRGAGGGRPPGLAGFPWERAAALGRFVLADGSAAAVQPTAVRIARDPRALYVRFECADRDAWGTYSQRNDPIYQEEAVEVFLAPGDAAPRRYWELEVSPLGVLFAARIENRTGRRADLVADTSWECQGLEWQAGPAGTSQDWWAALAIPWAAFAGRARSDGGSAQPGSQPPRRWRANFYRIERPRGGAPELSCWSPTLTDPPDFHRPERFGVLELEPVERN